jgi:hypothetical protein
LVSATPHPLNQPFGQAQGIAEKNIPSAPIFINYVLIFLAFFTDIIPPSLRKDLTVDIWLLMLILFRLARIQGTTDDRRDAVNEIFYFARDYPFVLPGKTNRVRTES